MTDTPNPHEHQIRFTVNGKPVVSTQSDLTGLQIKDLAIAQHVNIRPDFVLFEDLHNGQQVVVKDNQVVTLRENMRFDAVPNDDNS